MLIKIDFDKWFVTSCRVTSCRVSNCRFLVVVFQNVPWEMSFTNLTVGVVVYEMSRYDLS